MPKSVASSPRLSALSRRGLLTVMASSAVVLLGACSSPAENTPSPTGSAPPSETAPAPSSTAPSSSPAASTAATESPKELVAGFPRTVLPLMPNATLQTSSVEMAEPVSNASLTASITAPTADVVAFYTQSFTEQGFTAQPDKDVDGVLTKDFVRANGQEIIALSVIQVATTATFTVGANLLTASFK